jgi:hypothetical protein
MVFPIVGGTQDTSYEIENSLRFNDDDSPKVSRSISSSGSARNATLSVWVKRGNLGTRQQIYSNKTADSGFSAMNMYFNASNDRLYIDHHDGSSNISLYTTQVFRDPSAWYHIVHAIDTTTGTATNRLRLYINGTEVTDFATDQNPSQNADLAITNSTGDQSIGDDPRDSNDLFDGYMAEFNFVDGTTLDPTYFGETNDNGVWIPKKPDVSSYGTNGFYLEFKQTGTSANSSGIGADTSGNDNHMSVTNLAATDVTEDTPTNNFATMNSVASIATLSEGNCKVVTTNGQRMAGASTIGFENGKWYMEYKVTDINSTNMTIGIDNENGLSFSDFRDNDDFWNASNAYAYENNGNKRTTSVNSSYGNSYTTGDIIGVAVDMDNRKIYFSKNGTYQNSGDPTTGSTGTGSAFDLTDGLTYFFQAADNSSAAGVTLEANFGNPSFSISSGNSDGKYGNFEYAPPSGYYALCTKRLAEFG